MSTISPTAGRRSREDLQELAREFTQLGSKTAAPRAGFKLALAATVMVGLGFAGWKLWPDQEAAPRAHASSTTSYEAERLQQALAAQRERAKAQARWQDSHQQGNAPGQPEPSK